MLVDHDCSAPALTAGERERGAAIAAEHCAEQIIRGAHLADHIEGDLVIDDARGIDLHTAVVEKLDLGPDEPQDLDKYVDVLDQGEIFYYAGLPREYSGGDYRERGVFRSAYRYVAFKRPAARYLIICHKQFPLSGLLR